MLHHFIYYGVYEMDINSLSGYEKAEIETFLNRAEVIDAISNRDWNEIFTQQQLSLRCTLIRQLFQDAGLVTQEELLASLPYIPAFLFNNDSEITEINIPDAIKSIDYQAFNRCAKLTSVTIGQGVTSISSTAFANCPNLKEVTFQNTPLRTIGLGAFAYDIKLKNLELPSTLEKIEARPFSYTSITELKLPSSLISLDSQAFAEMSFLKEITIPNKIIRLPFQAFNNDVQLETVTLPRSLNIIDNSVFRNCTSLNKIIYEGSEKEWDLITKYPNWNMDMTKDVEIIYLDK